MKVKSKWAKINLKVFFAYYYTQTMIFRNFILAFRKFFPDFYPKSAKYQEELAKPGID